MGCSPVRGYRVAQPPVILFAGATRPCGRSVGSFCSLIRIVEKKFSNILALAVKTLKQVSCFCSLIRIFALNCINVSCRNDFMKNKAEMEADKSQNIEQTPVAEPQVQGEEPLKRRVLDEEDVAKMSPWLGRHPKFIKRLFKFLSIDKVNDLHEHNIDNPGGGPGFVRGMLEELDIKLRIDNAEVLDKLPEGAFVTVSNHHFGALDGIILIDIVASRRPKYKVMVNMVLNHISGMRSNFIAVDALASDNPKKKAVSMKGIKDAIRQVRSGEPVGFFPAGAVAKVNWRGRLKDREWQPNISLRSP